MSQKVWMIDDPGFKLSPGTNPDGGRKKEGKPGKTGPPSETTPKNPALSFSFSMLGWGGGHLYLRTWRPGLIYLAAMVLCCAVVGIGFTSDIPELNLGAMGVFLIGTLAWVASAVDAYYRTIRLRTEPFLGVERLWLPVGGSLLFPGWGQFLNGQPRKGMFFLLFGVGGLFCAFIVLQVRHVWPTLVINEDRQLFETCLAGALGFLPVVFLMWIVSVYDAFRSCEYFLRYKQRSKLEGKRVLSRNYLRDLIPQCSAVLGFMLAVSLAMQFCPKQFYLDNLNSLRLEMLNSHMTILPEWIQKTVEFLS